MKRKDPTRLADLKLRVEEQLRRQIEASAAQNSRSMSAEMVARLRDSFSREKQFEVSNELLDEIMGPPALRVLSGELIRAFAMASEQFARAHKLEGGFTDWNNDGKCWEAATVATILSLAKNAPAGPTEQNATLRSLIRNLEKITRGHK